MSEAPGGIIKKVAINPPVRTTKRNAENTLRHVIALFVSVRFLVC